VSQEVILALDGFVQKYVSEIKENSVEMLAEYDPNWPSECYLKSAEAGEQVQWKPILRNDLADFSGIESALELTIHPDIKAFYARYWSDNLNAKSEKGSLQLLQAWNREDFERLQQNLVGHILMKRRLKQPETLFFGVTDEEDFILTLDNSTGQVMLEQVGIRPTEVLAPSMVEFLNVLEPDFETL
jgi:SecY interacting protein Syd